MRQTSRTIALAALIAATLFSARCSAPATDEPETWEAARELAQTAAGESRFTDAEAAYRRQAAEELWLEYRRTASALESRGVMLVRARADALAAAAVQRYLEVKTQGRL